MTNELHVRESYRATAVEVAAVAMAATVLLALSASSESQAAAKPGQEAATIDVTNYPAAARDSYKVFTAKCAECHTLNRVIAAPYLLPDQWTSCVERMMNKWFSGIKKPAGQQIQDFLIYDSSVRKKAEVDAALAKLSAEAKKAAEDKIKEVQLGYEKETAKP